MKTYTEDSFVDAGSLPALEPILKSWLDVQRTYADAVGSDDGPAWCYQERTCIGFLSAAAWSCGGVTLEEWNTTRTKSPGEPSSRGRCDLYISHNKKQFFIEAKLLPLPRFQYPEYPEYELGLIRQKLENAVSDASALDWKNPAEKLGILFVVPVYYPGTHPADFDEDITEWLKRADTVQHSAMAWLFPQRKQIQGYQEPFSPGILLLARTPQ